MKNTLKIFGIVILTAAVMLSMSTCDEGGGGGGSAFLGETLKLSGQVWTVSMGETGITWIEFTGTTTVTAYSYDDETKTNVALGATGTITGGQLSIEIGVPTNLESGNFSEYESGGYWTNFKVSDTNVKTASLGLETATGFSLTRVQGTFSAESMSQDSASYIYVDRNVTITGKGGTQTSTCNCDEYGGTCECDEDGDPCDCGGKTTVKDLNLNLKKGWNAITMKMAMNASGYEIGITEGVGSTRWVLSRLDSD